MTEEKNRHIAFICSKGDLDMVYPALIMGWAALGNGIDVTLFFTFWGLDMVTEKRVDRLEMAPVANTSMKMKMMGLPTGNLGIPNIMGIIPGMTAFTSWFLKKEMKKLGVPPVREYLEMLSDGGAKMYGCKMTVDMFNIKDEDFLPFVQGVVTASDFMDMTEGAQIVFI
jgi:peroxiredoxin family protein